MAGSGSEKRQRSEYLKARVTPEEKARFSERAARAGLSEADLLRSAALDAKPLRASRRPSVDRRELCRLIAVFGEVADGLRALEPAGSSPLEIEAMQRDLADMRAAALEALGRPP